MRDCSPHLVLHRSYHAGLPTRHSLVPQVCLKGGSLLCCDNCPRTFHRKCVESVAVEIGHAKPSDVSPNKTAMNEPWVCVHCVELSHAQTCVVSGHYGGDGGHLVPCVSCPRAFHPLVVSDLAAGPAVDSLPSPISCSDEGKWRCRWCTSVTSAGATVGNAWAVADTAVGHAADAAASSSPSVLRRTELEILRRTAQELSKLPRGHWASVVGSRIEACVDMEQVVADAGAVPSGMRETRNGVVETQRRLFYCNQMIEATGDSAVLSTSKGSSSSKDASNGRKGAAPGAIGKKAAAVGASAAGIIGGVDSSSLLAKTAREFLLNGFCAPTDAQWSVPREAAEVASAHVLTRCAAQANSHTTCVRILFTSRFSSFRTESSCPFDCSSCSFYTSHPHDQVRQHDPHDRAARPI
jgi:hypothetical protein